ncbi:MAG: shikimate dehydrogenase [Gammaproteobacteria bacterium]
MIRLAVFGSPISHSRSPEIHRAFARQCALKVDYRAIEARPETFPRLLEELAARGGRGCNVTVPLKHEAWKLAQKSSDSTRRARAANTLLFRTEKDWFADNTDGRGLVRDLVSNLDHPLSGSRVCIIGAGGAVAGILGDLLAQSPASIVIANRTLQRATQLHAQFAGFEAIPLADLHLQDPFDLVINATSLGHDGNHPGLPPSMFHPDGLCYDLNYGAAAEPLRNFCLEAKIRYQDGWGMLVEQAALSFELWTGRMPATEPVLKQL